MGKVGEAIKAYEAAIDAFPARGCPLPSAMRVSSAFFVAMTKAFEASESTQRLHMREIQLLTDLFVACPTVPRCRHFAKALVEASQLIDVLSVVVLRTLAEVENRFVFVLLLVREYFASSTEMEMARFMALVEPAENLRPASRKLALKRLAEKRLAEAFLLAAAETDDEAVLSAIGGVGKGCKQ